MKRLKVVLSTLLFFFGAHVALFGQPIPTLKLAYPVSEDMIARILRSNGSGYLFKEPTLHSSYPLCSSAPYHPGWDMNVNVDNNPNTAGDEEMRVMNDLNDNLEVYAAADGIVRKVWVDQNNVPTIPQGYPLAGNPAWNGLVIEHNIGGQSYYSCYGHMARIDVVENQNVYAGVTQVGVFGKVGTSASHLHFEIRRPSHPDLLIPNSFRCNTSYGNESLLHNEWVDGHYWNPEQFIKGIPAVGMQRNGFHPQHGAFFSTYLSYQQVGPNPWDVNQFYDRVWDNGTGDIYVHYWPHASGNPDQAGHADALWVQDFKSDQTQEWSQLVYNPTYSAVIRVRGKILEYWNSHTGYSAYGPPVNIESVGTAVASNGTVYQNAVRQVFKKGTSGTPYMIFVNPTNQLAEVTTEGVVGGSVIQTRQITFTSSPSGAGMYLNGGLLGTAPFTTFLFQDVTYSMVAKLNGYQDTPFSFTVGSQDMTVPVTMLPLGSVGTLSVSTDPNGAEIWLDGVRWPNVSAVTPQSNIEVPVGVHPIRFVKSGYQPYEQNVTINQGQLTQLLGIVLQPPPGTKPHGDYWFTSEASGAAFTVWDEAGFQLFNGTTPSPVVPVSAWSLTVGYILQGTQWDTTFSVVNNDNKTIHKVMNPVLSVSTTALYLGNAQSGTLSGSFNVSNATDVGTLSWTVSKVGNISVSPTSGTNSGTVNVSVLLDGLADGTYRDTVFVASSYGNKTVVVRYFKGNPPTFSDDFNRTELGSNWQTVNNVSIVDNQASLSGSGGGADAKMYCLAPGNIKNVEVEFDWGAYVNGGNTASALVLQWTDASNYCEISTWIGSPGYTLFRRFVGGQLVEYYHPSTFLAPGRYLASVVNDEITLVNINGGTPINVSWKNTSLASLPAGKVGFWANEGTRKIDNVTIRNLDVQPPVVTNLIKDPECAGPFTQNELDGWTWFNNASSGTHTVSFTTTNPLSGSSSILGYNDTAVGQQVGIKQLMNLVAGRQYRVSFIHKSENAGPFECYADIYSTANWTSQNGWQTYMMSDQQGLVNYTFTAASTALSIIWIQFGNALGYFRVDSVSVVDLTAEQNPILSVSTTNLNFGSASTGTLNGSFGISNTGGGTLSWTNTKDGNIAVSPLNGTGNSTVNVSVNVSGVSLGNHTDNVYVSSNGGNATVNVSYTVTSSGDYTDDPNNLFVNGQANTVTSLDQWTTGYWFAEPRSGSNMVQFTSNALYGENSLEIIKGSSQGGADNTRLLQIVNLTGGTEYRLVALIDNSSNISGTASITNYMNGGSWSWQNLWWEQSLSPGQKRIVVDFTPSTTFQTVIQFQWGSIVGSTRLDSLIIKVKALGKETAEEDVETVSIPTSYMLYQNHPNPFNPVTTIVFDVPEKSRVLLSVYNLVGQKVAVLVDGDVEAGRHRVSWDATANPSGVYLYELKSGSFRSIRKMAVVK